MIRLTIGKKAKHPFAELNDLGQWTSDDASLADFLNTNFSPSDPSRFMEFDYSPSGYHEEAAKAAAKLLSADIAEIDLESPPSSPGVVE